MSSIPASAPPASARQGPLLALGRLRAAIVIAVLAQHALVAYAPFAPEPRPSLAAEPRTWLAFPVVDRARSSAVVIPLVFNDVFGMALMFLVSGLFVPMSLTRKGPHRYLRDRAIRLGVPFFLAATVLTPLAYYPSYLATAPAPSIGGFVRHWLGMGWWPGGAGPAWFLWMLLAFDVAVVALRVGTPGALRLTLRRRARRASDRPLTLWCVIVIASTIAYLPLVLAVGPGTWSQIGPFKLQPSRILLYLVYFLAGVAIGDLGIERGLLADAGWLPRRWAAWVAAALLAFGAYGAAVSAAFLSGRPAIGWDVGLGLLFVVSCATSSLAVLATFARFAGGSPGPLDVVIPNAYGIYVVHYVFVTWLQHALLTAPWIALVKAGVVFLGALASSWLVTAGLRTVPAIRRIL